MPQALLPPRLQRRTSQRPRIPELLLPLHTPSSGAVTDPRTLVVKFRRGLKLGIQNQIATMLYGRPTDTDLNTWYRAARRIDQARLANKAFQSVSRSTPSGPAKTISVRPPPMSVVRLPPAPPLPVTPKPLPPTPSMGVPMDVDATRKMRPLPL